MRTSLPKAASPFEAFAVVGTGEEASRQGQRVADGEASMDRSGREELLPEALFELPEVGCLPSESGAMYLAEGGGPFAVAPPEKAVDGLIGVYAEELAD